MNKEERFLSLRKLSFIKFQNLVTSKNGKLISSFEEYKNNLSKLEVSCSFNHKWFISLSNLSNNKWCPTCSKNKKLSLNDAILIAKEYKAECLSNCYKNNREKLLWKCKYDHLFWMNLNSIRQNGNWCPFCSKWKSEEICRLYFESIFNQPFPKVRPNWLINDKGNKLELDGYCADLNLAFEHQGEHHYLNNITGKTNFFSKIDLKLLQKNDLIKKKLCAQHNVTLIEIPQLFKKTKLENLKSIIQKQLPAHITNYSLDVKIDFKRIYVHDIFYKKLQEMILEKNGTLVSDQYISSSSKVEVICQFGHNFFTSSNSIKNGSWCPKCARNKKLTIQEMQNIAHERGGKCLSLEIVNARTHLKWECGKCHNIWFAVPYSIKNQKSWCPKCARNKHG